MMEQPIVTSRLLMDLEDVARTERLTPLDPWGNGPGYIPEDCHEAIVLRLDGAVERVPDPAYADPDWTTIAAVRFEDSLGNELPMISDDWEPDDW